MGSGVKNKTGAGAASIRGHLLRAFIPVALAGALLSAGEMFQVWRDWPAPAWAVFMALLAFFAWQWAVGKARQEQGIASLAESEEKFRTAANAVQEAIVMIDSQGRIIFWNRSATRIFGYSQQEALGKGIHALLAPPELREKAAAGMQRFRETGEGSVFIGVQEQKARHKDGYCFPVELSVGVTRIHGQNVAIGSLRDISRRKMAERAAQNNRARLKEAQAVAHLGHWDLDLVSNQFNCSDEVLSICGLPLQKDGYSLTDLLRLTLPEDRVPLRKAYYESLRGKKPYDIIHGISRADGEVRIVRQRGRTFYDGNGNPIRSLGTIQDITRQKRAEQQIRELNDQLEERVGRRTRDLIDANLELRRQIGGRQKAEKALVDGEKRFRLTFDEAPMAAAIVGVDNCFVRVNDQLSKLLGYSEEELVGKSFLDITHPDDAGHSKDMMQRSAAGVHDSYQIDKRYLRKDGSVVWCRVYTRLLRDDQGDPLYYLPMIEDITSLVKARDDLLGAKEAAEAANRAKDDFIANMSHEVRTPMNSILGMLHLCQQTGLTNQQREYLQDIHTAANALMDLFDDMLDICKLDSGGIKLEKFPFDLREILGTAEKAGQSLAEAKGLALKFEIDPGVPVAVRGDPKRLSQILDNLIDNAVKFTETGSVSVQVEPREPGTPSELLVTVSDTGIGISAEQRAQIFSAFTQVDASSTRRYCGTGLGLAICKSLVEMMGGDIWVRSEPGMGSTFCFSIVLEVMDGAQSPAGGRPVAASPEDAGPGAACPGGEDAGLASGLAELAGMLSLSDTRAADCFARIASQLAAASPEDAKKIGAMINDFDFKAALRLVRRLAEKQGCKISPED